MTIYFDMDGTIADLYSVNDWLKKIRSEDATPYANACPMCDTEAVERKFVQLQYFGIKIGIISWCSKAGTKEFNAKIRKVKKEWLKQNFPKTKFNEIHIVKYGVPKEKIAKDNGILIDDEENNRFNWELNYQETFDPTKKTIESILDEILERFAEEK